jgi:DNA polymerase III epsilon subunit-like protein
MNILAFDLETGGKDPQKHSPLTIYMRVLSDSLEFIDDIHLKIKPDKSAGQEYNVTEEALKITKINLEEHDKEAIVYSEASKLLIAFLKKHKIKNKRKHFRPLGQNVAYDIKAVNAFLIPEDVWSDELGVHYNSLDTLQIVTFLKDISFIPDDLGNLESLVKYFNIPSGDYHNEKEDVLMTIEVYKKFKNMFISKKTDFAGSSNNSLLAIIEQ